MRAFELLKEAAYDSMIASMKKKYPDVDQHSAIDWGKSHLKKQDRVVWYLRLLDKHFTNPNDKNVLSNKSLPEFQENLLHYIGQTHIPQIQNYVFKDQTSEKILNDLNQIEQEIQKKTDDDKRPAGLYQPEKGDYVIAKFSDGSSWHYLNRAYCDIEGKSGKHCGNVVGQHKTDQKILSLRDKSNRVILTFVLEPDGTLGEMKHIGNTKPPERYHPAIMSLLLSDLVKGISGMGYLPDSNFSVFDLDDQNLQIVQNKKPNLIIDQLKITPTEILNAPEWIKKNNEYVETVSENSPLIRKLIASPDLNTWEEVVKQNPNYILYAPDSLPDYREKLLAYLIENGVPNLLLKVKSRYRKDFNFLNDLISNEVAYLAAIPPNTKGYEKLALNAVKKFGDALRFVPEEMRTPEICLTAVKQNGLDLKYVPEEMRTPELCLIAVKQNGYALMHVPEEMITPELCLIAVKQNGYALKHVPEEMRTPELCLIAVKQNGYALLDVPEEMRTPELCLIAVKQNARALRFVPDKLKPQIQAALEKENSATNEDLQRLKLLAGIR